MPICRINGKLYSKEGSIMKTTLTLLILLLVFSINTLAQEFPYTSLRGHTDDVTSVAFSPDGQILASGSTDETIRLWNVNTGELLETIEGHTDDVTSIAFSPDGQILASGSTDETIRLWNADIMEADITEMEAEVLWNLETGAQIEQQTENTEPLLRILEGHEWEVTSVAFSPDGQILASGSYDETIRLWNVNAGTLLRTLEGHEWEVTSVAFSPDGKTLASGSRDETTRLWNVETGELLKTLRAETEEVLSVAFSPDGQTLASGRSGNQGKTINLWDANTGALLRTLERWSIMSVAFSPDGQILASGSSSGIDLWDVNTGTHQKKLEHESTVTSVAFSPDGQILASGSYDETIRLWELPATHIRITPYPVEAPAIGEQFTVNISITEGQNVGGYQATVEFDPTALRYVESINGDYLPPGAFFVPPVVSEKQRRVITPTTNRLVSYPIVTLGAAALAGTANGHGTLATITFEVLDLKESFLVPSDVILTDSDGEHLPHHFFGGLVIPSQIGPEDVNGDGVINILDLVKVAARFGQASDGTEDVNRDGVVNVVDLVKVAGALGGGAAAPSLHPQVLAMFTAADVQQWLSQTQQLNLTDATSQRGILFLEHLLAALTPKETTLLPNYPNPFNPETWIPYQLAEPSEVTLTIYAIDGTMVRTLALGHQPVGIYQDKSRAAYWNGRNEVGESVASGVYFYTLTAGDFTATRKMLIRK